MHPAAEYSIHSEDRIGLKEHEIPLKIRVFLFRNSPQENASSFSCFPRLFHTSSSKTARWYDCMNCFVVYLLAISTCHIVILRFTYKRNHILVLPACEQAPKWGIGRREKSSSFWGKTALGSLRFALRSVHPLPHFGSLFTG